MLLSKTADRLIKVYSLAAFATSEICPLMRAALQVSIVKERQ